ncbi:hypothetical protein R3P38DRAFT_3291150 [Favolaschia claudopus]|uniref:Alpha-type protein kinase domain-containing protein n=1 Tax=Favolaschia claudopus TaxID=2862362 RepID=A0AAV9ZPJ7_9AGAR
MSQPLEVYAQFTDDVRANRPVVCERSSCGVVLQPGDQNRHLVRNQNPNLPDRVVCSACYNWILGKPDTLVRGDISERAAAVRRQALDAKRKDATPLQRQVTAVPPNYSMPPPPPPASMLPHINVPSSWGAPGHQSTSSTTYFQPNGYSAAHASYGAERQAWASRAYHHDPAESIGLILQILHEVPGKLKGTLVLNLSEGKEVPAKITPAGLRGLIIQVMGPRLAEATNGYPFPLAQMPLREVVRWIDLGQEDQNSPWFYNRYMGKPNHKQKDKTMVYKRPKVSIAIALVFPAPQWEAYIDWDENGNNLDVTDRESNSSEDEESRPRTPPQSRKRGPPAYVSPDRSRLAKVLAVGGQPDVTAGATPLGSEQVEFYAIEPPSLHELLDPELQHLSRFTCTPDEASQGFLAIQSNLSIGCGTFKTAHRGWITLHHLRDVGLGTTKNELVVVKRTFRELSNKSGGQTVYTRYSSPEEHKIILKEANNLYWAISIMGFSYSYIYSFDTLDHQDCPPIPDLRFVQAGVAIYYETPAKNSSKASIRKTYLLEEYIETNSDSEFVKFVHNGSAVPLLDADDAWRWIADFLCFTQHIQYWKSGEMVFLSDLQGSDILLTDPQIMTSPKIAEGADLFADGNVGSVFEQFPDQHVCNQYCVQTPRAVN